MTQDKKAILEARKSRKKHKPYSSISYTTGDISLNIDRFNTAMGTDFGVADGASEGGALCEAKRYVRRYYIRPQNIFCSNKAEIIKALIELDDANCSVYTLNNLGDEKDVSKLMNSDIIYYYDEGILYDKNRVKVMDYDLSIKKEEERKHFANVDKASEKEFKSEYEDRMTDATELEETLTEAFGDTDKALAMAITDAYQELVSILYTHKSVNRDGWAKSMQSKLKNLSEQDARALLASNLMQKVQPKGARTPITFPNVANTSPVLNAIIQSLKVTYENALQKLSDAQANRAAELATQKADEIARQNRELADIEADAIHRAEEDFADGEGIKSADSEVCQNIEKLARRARVSLANTKSYTLAAKNILRASDEFFTGDSVSDFEKLKTTVADVAYCVTLKRLEAELRNLNRTSAAQAEQQVAALSDDDKQQCKAWALKYIKRIEFLVPMGEDLIDLQEADIKLENAILKRFNDARKAFYKKFKNNSKLENTLSNLDSGDLETRKLKRSKELKNFSDKAVVVGHNITARARYATNSAGNVEATLSNYKCWGVLSRVTLTSRADAFKNAPSGIMSMLELAKAIAAENTYTGTAGSEEEGVVSNQINSTTFAYCMIELFDNDPDFLASSLKDDDNPFDLDFADINAYGEKLTEAKESFCCICGEPIEGYGNNPEPYASADEGRCCDSCNIRFVLPARMEMMED